MRLIIKLCASDDGSYNERLWKSFFIDAHSIIKISERNETNKLKYRWINLTLACYDYDKLIDTLHHKIILYIAGFGIKKLDRAPIKCRSWLNKLLHEQYYASHQEVKNWAQHNMHCVNLRDDEGLIWSSNIVVLICDVLNIFFEIFQHLDGLMNNYFFHNHSVGRL